MSSVTFYMIVSFLARVQGVSWYGNPKVNNHWVSNACHTNCNALVQGWFCNMYVYSSSLQYRHSISEDCFKVMRGRELEHKGICCKPEDVENCMCFSTLKIKIMNSVMVLLILQYVEKMHGWDPHSPSSTVTSLRRYTLKKMHPVSTYSWVPIHN